jgi:dolichol-phosphate mannosyltransferase
LEHLEHRGTLAGLANLGDVPKAPAAGPSFCVVVPMYNEEAGAAACVREVCAVLDTLPQRSVLVVVEDGSRDRTAEIVEALAPNHSKLHLVRHAQNRGYGRALRTGVEWASRNGYDYALFMDSDLTNNPADIPRFVREMQRGADVIKASRFRGGGGMQGVPLRRALISRTGNWVAQMLFGMGIRDCTNGFRAVRVPILERMDLRENGFPIIVEELYQSKFLATRFAEVPVVLTNRQGELRGTSFSYKPSTFFRYLRYGFRARLNVRPASGHKGGDKA